MPFSPDDVSFVLSTETSFISSKKGKVRKIHLLTLAPDFETVEKINGRLAGIGNLRSDGRPILGMDARNFVNKFIREFENEQKILTEVPISELTRIQPEKVGQGIDRMRKSLVKIVPGHDGEYGIIRLFEQEEEKNALDSGQLSLF